MVENPGVRARRILVLLFTWLLAAVSGRSAQSPNFAGGTEIGSVGTYDVSEASGLVASRQNPGVLWTHNDSTFRGSIFALATNGTYLARYDVPQVFTGDFEDIAIGPGPLPQFQYIYLGDIGDNNVTREDIRVFRFPEPAAYRYQSNAAIADAIWGAQEIVLRYPDGPFDAEAMMMDPFTGDLFIATKETNSCRLYRATRAELDSGDPVTLTFIREVAFRSASASDISADGSLIAIRRASRASLWVRQAGETVGDALARTPINIPVIGQDASPAEPNGESIAFNPNASGYFTVSEGAAQPIYYFKRTDSVPPQPRVFIAPAAPWHYDDNSLLQPPSWRTNLSDHWLIGPAPLGFGGREQTTVFSDEFFPTTYFRRVFTNNATVTNLALRICFNDGVVVFLNGTEVLRRNLPANASGETFALASNLEQANYWFSTPLNPGLLKAGTNVIAVEVHRAEGSRSMNFDLQLVEGAVESAPRISSVRLVSGFWCASVTGPNGLRVAVETSTNFNTWQFDRFVTLTNGTATFCESATNRALFFRTRQ